MPKTKVDPEQVVAMSVYLTNAVIAKRLDISERQVSRILANKGKDKTNPEKRNQTDKELEDYMIRFLNRLGMSYGAIAYRFGLTRQAIEQKCRNQQWLTNQ